MNNFTVSAITGAIFGTISTLITLWIKWIIEQKRGKNQSRREKIKRWRKEIDESKSFAEFITTSTYGELISRFSDSERESFSHIWLNKNPNINSDRLKLAKFHDEVSKIEKEWGFV